VIARGTTEARKHWAHSVHVEIAGLEPGRPYWYRFTALGEQSPIGLARTAPAPDAKLARMRFAFASCANWQHGYFSAYRHLGAENPDLVIFLGDYIYEETATGANADKVLRKHDGPTAVDLAGYRNRYALYRTDPDLQVLHAAVPCLMTWDDHEVENDYANQWSLRPEVTPEQFLLRRASAYQAYYEHMPLRAASMTQGSALRLYDRFRFGDLVAFSVLDGRQYRSKQACELPDYRGGHVAPDACTERLDPARTCFGAEQEKWLFNGFKKSDATWNVIAQEQLVAQLHQKDRAGKWGYWTDGWDAYPAARERMLNAIAATRVSNPVFIGGDLHSYCTTDLKADFDTVCDSGHGIRRNLHHFRSAAAGADLTDPSRKPACALLRERLSRIRRGRPHTRPHGDAAASHFRPPRSARNGFHAQTLCGRKRQTGSCARLRRLIAQDGRAKKSPPAAGSRESVAHEDFTLTLS